MIHIIDPVVNEAFGVAQVEGPKKYDYSSGILAVGRISVAAARYPGRTCRNQSLNIYASRIFSSILDASPQADRRLTGQVQAGQVAEPGGRPGWHTIDYLRCFFTIPITLVPMIDTQSHLPHHAGFGAAMSRSTMHGARLDRLARIPARSTRASPAPSLQRIL
ncbi:hypothetical protein [Devosia sp.]|uniref:hypothetical protein n=1 Tax=Devosia sp. TaxID=1871048 RepID=UPI002732AF0C|nr:hypothetical protein [Devosia sp.]MDP2780502.1 hypothetical protein [Devosia sp.]